MELSDSLFGKFMVISGFRKGWIWGFNVSEFVFPFSVFFYGVCLNQDSPCNKDDPPKPQFQAVRVHTCGLFFPAPKSVTRRVSFNLIWQRSWGAPLFPGGSDGRASLYNAGDLGSIPGSGRFPEEGNGNPLQYSCLENPMDGRAWCRLLRMRSQRVGHDWATSLLFIRFITITSSGERGP